MAKKYLGKRVLALLLALTLCFSNSPLIASARDNDRDWDDREEETHEEANWSYAYYLGQEYLGNAPGAANKPDPVGYGFQGVITSITFQDDAGKTWTFNWSSVANGEWRITGSGVTKDEAAAWPQITSGKVYYGSGYAFTLSEDGSASSWTYANDSSRHANWFRYLRFLGPYTVNVYYENETGGYSYAGETFALHQSQNRSFYFQYPNNGIIGDSEYEDSEYSSAITLYPSDYLPAALASQGYELKYATDADGNDVMSTGVPIHLLGRNVLNVYCTLIPPVTENYTVVHNYYVEGTFEGTQSGGTVEVPQGSDFAQIVAGIPKLTTYNENTYDYIRYDVNPGSKVITLTYTRMYPTYGYTVTYHENFGESTATASDAENVTAVRDTAYTITVDENTYFTQATHDFIGWNTEPDGSGTTYAPAEVIPLTAEANAEDLYAQWQPKPKYDYTVIYNENFGSAPETVADTENVTQVYDTTKAIGVDGNPFPAPNHFRFLGWATTAEGTVAYVPGMSLTFTEGGYQELFAVWEEDPKYAYSLIYDGNGGALTDGTTQTADEENVTGVYDTAWVIGINGNGFVLENHTFTGWNTAPDGSGTTYQVGDSFSLTATANSGILYAQWEENPKYDYAVIYNENYGENPATAADAENVTQVYTTPYTITADENTYFQRPNYHFLGWSLTPTKGQMINPGEGITFTPDSPSEVTLYAIWEEDTKYDYTVIYNANFGEAPETLADGENVTQVYDTTKTFGIDANTFIRENYDFIGWAVTPEGPVSHLPGSEVTFTEGGSLTLYAQWREHDKFSYTLVYDGNGGILENTDTSYGDEENVLSTYSRSHSFHVDENTFVLEHHTFLGWNTQADGEGIGYAQEDILQLTAEDNTLILYAQWEEHPRYDYAVTYNANFGETPETAADIENVTQVFDTTKIITVDACGFHRNGYRFLGWAIKPEGLVVYHPGDSISFYMGGSAELYAKWERIEYPYTVQYLVRIDEGEYVPFAGTLPEGAHLGGKQPLGTVVGKEIVQPVSQLQDADYTYTYAGIDEIIIAEAENIVKVYYQYWTPAPEDVDPDPTEPDPTDPEPTDPEPTDPEPTDPEPTDPEPTDPEPTDPEPTDPEPTDPEPTDPEPTDPEPTDPEPTDPEPDEPRPEEPKPIIPQPRDPVDIPDEDVPKADVPKTGDPMLIYIGMTAISGLGMLFLGRKKEENEEEA